MLGPEERLFEEPVESNRAKDQDAAPQFVLLEISPQEQHRRRASFGISSAAQVVALTLFLWLLTIPPAPRNLEGVYAHPPVTITLLAPPPLHFHPRPRPTVPPTPRPAKRPPELPKLKPKIKAPPVSPPVSAKLQPIPAPPRPAPAVPRKAEVPRPIRPIVPSRETQTHVGVFNSGPALAKLKLPASRVQTGGFGNPDGLAAKADDKSRPNVQRLGSFDRPEGPGSGNGTGGQHGARTLVASAGFGDGAAGPVQVNQTAGDGQVHSDGFAGAESLTRAPAPPKSQAMARQFEPVTITSKPDPVYTAEARRLHVEGEVILRVLFTASGQVRILGVERGLGHGLDEAAVRAAQQIQFKPARRNGRPVDTTAMLHIVFQLAS